MSDIIQPENTETDGSQNYSAAPVSKSCCELGEAMRVGSGKRSMMPADKLESATDSSTTNRDLVPAISFDRLATLLIESGLIAGSIPTSMREKSNQMLLGTVTEWQRQNHGGKVTDIQKAD